MYMINFISPSSGTHNKKEKKKFRHPKGAFYGQTNASKINILFLFHSFPIGCLISTQRSQLSS